MTVVVTGTVNVDITGGVRHKIFPGLYFNNTGAEHRTTSVSGECQRRFQMVLQKSLQTAEG